MTAHKKFANLNAIVNACTNAEGGIRNSHMEEALREIIEAVRQGLEQPDKAPDSAWLAKLVRRYNRKMHDGTRQVAKRRLLPFYMRLRADNPQLLATWNVTQEVHESVVALLQAKPRRTASGVATVTVITKPHTCSSDCIYCPNDVRMPKSYLSNEPACQRAERNYFDPYLQVNARLRVLADMGHVTDKVELIVLGGTFNDYPLEYQTWFMSELFRALNEFGTSLATESVAIREAFYAECGIKREPDELETASNEAQKAVDAGDVTYNQAIMKLYFSDIGWAQVSKSQKASFRELEEQQRANVSAGNRCVGLVIETRPDLINAENLVQMRRFGCTKIQMGIQSLNENILQLNKRNVSLEQIERAFALLRLFGFKSHIHMMANLPGATPESDVAEYRQLVQDPRFLPDEVKLYPCALVGSSRLTELYKEGLWHPYSEEQLVNLLATDVLETPAWTRISRMIRDISATDIIAGNKKTNLRQMVEERVQEICETDNAVVREMRMREIATSGVSITNLKLLTIVYETTVSEERFLQWITPENNLAGFLRLSLPKSEELMALNSELSSQLGFPQSNEAMIREVHVYGKVTALHEEGDSAQHAGLGRQLVEAACEQTASAGYSRINVISAIGTQEYYASLGFRSNALYMQRTLE